jgi:integrase
VPSIIKLNGRWRALVRKAGVYRCSTFDTKGAAKTWATKLEAELDGYRATGKFDARRITLADLIQRHTAEVYPLKPYGVTKQRELAKLEREIGTLPAGMLTAADLTRYYARRVTEGAGPVTISASLAYLGRVLRIARDLWHYDVPLDPIREARSALALVGRAGKSKRRDRRVTNAEIAKLTKHFRAKRQKSIPMADIIEFAVASGMRLGEICRIEWADYDRKARIVTIRDRKHPQDKLGNDQRVPLLNATGFDAAAIVARQPRGAASRIFPVYDRSVSDLFRRAVSDLKLGDLHFHDLRHESISRLFEAGFRIEQVALVSGHRDWAMLRRYVHPRAEDLVSA